MHILAVDDLSEQDFVTVDVLLNTKSGRASAANVLVFRFAGQVFAYVNHCMHMHKALTCQEYAIFDEQRRWLRCSMHGFIFEPQTGVCVSPVCEGQKLQSIRVAEEHGMIVFKEKHLQVLAVHKCADAMTQEVL
ncbi:MAG: Rieske 2Fe-2S domain-containing protein [Methylococcales bacterium]